MCRSDITVPKSWRLHCLRKDRGVFDGDICSRFFSPDGQVFKTMEEVHQHNRDQERVLLEKEKRRIYSFRMDKDSPRGGFVQNKIPCDQCDKVFINQFMVKRHKQDVHEIPFRRRSARLRSSTSELEKNNPTIRSLQCNKGEDLKDPISPRQGPPGPSIPVSGSQPKTSPVEEQKYSSALQLNKSNQFCY